MDTSGKQHSILYANLSAKLIVSACFTKFVQVVTDILSVSAHLRKPEPFGFQKNTRYGQNLKLYSQHELQTFLKKVNMPKS